MDKIRNFFPIFAKPFSSSKSLVAEYDSSKPSLMKQISVYPYDEWSCGNEIKEKERDEGKTRN